MWPGPPRSCERARTNTVQTDESRHQNHEQGFFGDPIQQKNKDCVRILLHNTNGIGFVTDKRCKETLKMEKLKKLILSQDFDIVGLSEINKDWRKIQYDNSIWSATQSWHEHRRIQVSYNSTSPARKEFQPGGTAMMVMGELTFRISHQGSDHRNLGRWSSFTLTGKNEVNTTIFTCYCPVRSTSLGSTFSQHLLFMANNKAILPDVDCPRHLFGLDLQNEIDKFVTKGHNIMIMGDFNSHYDDLSKWMLDMGLIDLTANKHGKCPITHTRSASTPLDIIFGSANLKITKGGFLSFTKLLSDHRGIWIDIPKYLIYGFNPQHPVFPSAKRLKLRDPRIVSKYILHLLTSMTANDLFKRMDELHQQTTTHFSQRLIDEYELLDALVCRLMDEAEAQCRKIHAGAIPWSPTYRDACLSLEYWLKRRSYNKQENTNVRELIVLQNKLKIQYNPNLTIQDINHQIQAAYNKRQTCKQNAESLSLEYRTQLALAKEAAGEGDAAVILRNLNKLEKTRRLFRNIRRMENKSRGGCTSKVTTYTNGIEKEYTAKDQIDQVCADENQRKYHLPESGSSQFLEDAFIKDLGHHGEGPDMTKVLNGTYIPPVHTSPATQDYLDACATPPSILQQARHPSISKRYNIHTTSWKCRKEKTTTYNQSMAHYKAIFADKYISWYFFQRADIPEMTGYSPKRHRTCVDLMIMKKHQCFDIRKQRTLGILDTEYNQNNKRIGYEGMKNATDLNKIAREQFAIKNSAAVEQIVSKRAVIDHSQYMRKTILLASSDLEACYDRIIHTAASLALLRVGIPHSKINAMFATIQKMTHRIRTLYGDSEITWGGISLHDLKDWKNYPQGVLQGNACGPTIWALVSSIIFEILHKRGFAVPFCTSISQEVFKLVGFAYVDDSDLIQTGTNPIEVLASMQKLINMWGSLIDVTGGALSVEKSWWYMVDYVWTRGKWKATNAGQDLDLFATSPSGDLISLKRLHAHEASKMLGIFVAPDGNTEALVDDLKSAAISWGANMRTGHSTRTEAWTALNTNISAKLKYPLPACTLTEKECKSIMWPALKAALPKAGISSFMHSAYRDGPREYGGAGCLSLYHHQGSTRTALILESITRKTPTGYFLLLCLEDMVLDTGQYGSLWKADFTDAQKYIQSHSLLYHMWAYNVKNEIHISLKHSILSAQRENDTPIMALALKIFPHKKNLRSIQKMRMKLNVIHVSDITTADGTKLDPKFYSTSPPSIQRNTYKWPTKHHISGQDIALWRKFLTQIYHGTQHSLEQPLGAWHVMPNTQWRDNWDYFLTLDKEFLYHRVKSRWHRHLKRQHTHRSYHKRYLDLDDIPTHNIYRATVKPSANILVVTSFAHKPDTSLPPEPPSHKFGNIKLVKPKIDWFMNYVSSSPTTHNLWNDIIQGQAYAVSDGSFFPTSRTGACAWIVSTRGGEEWIKGGGIIPGSTYDQDPYRSELGGQVGLASFITSIILPTGVTPSITIACDGKAAIDRVNMAKNIMKSNMKNVDMLSIISDLWEDSPFNIIKQHVYGHQDDTGKELTQLEKLNCRVDVWAKEIAHIQMEGLLPTVAFHSTHQGYGTITCNGQLITSKIQNSLYKLVTKKHLLSALGKNTEVPKDFPSLNINWLTFGKARKEASGNIQTFITKWLSGDTATGRVMVARKERLLPKCPRCDHTDEHLVHVLTCRAASTIELQVNLISDLVLWLQSVYTLPTIVNFVEMGLSKWFNNQNHVWDHKSQIFSHKIVENQALHSQLDVGWFHFLCGMLTSELIDLQQLHYNNIESKRQGSRWAIDFTKKLWHVTHSLWKHRCSHLFTKDIVDELSGLSQLKPAITAEYRLGGKDLPHVYSSFFHLPLQALLNKNVKHLKRWFLIIRAAREAHTLVRELDNFSCNGPLRTWIGLLDNG